MGVQFFCIPFFVMRSEDAPRTVGGRFRYRISLPYHRSLFCAPNASGNAPRTTGGRFRYRVPPNEDVPRTVGGRFRYRISLPYRRSLFFTPNASENASRTTEACFSHRAHIPYQRRPSPVPNFSNCQKKESIARTEYNKRQKGRGPFLYGALKIHPVP